MTKTAKQAEGEAVSKNAPNANPATALVVTGDGDVSGTLTPQALLTLSTEKADTLMLEFQEALHQVTEGFQTLTKPGDVFAAGESFNVIDAITLNDFEDRQKGEIMTKHIFKLEYEDGRVVMVMQGDARPRRVLAELFQKARALQRRIKAGPYRYAQKPIAGQIQPAFIFEQQPGFAVLEA